MNATKGRMRVEVPEKTGRIKKWEGKKKRAGRRGECEKARGGEDWRFKKGRNREFI